MQGNQVSSKNYINYYIKLLCLKAKTLVALIVERIQTKKCILESEKGACIVHKVVGKGKLHIQKLVK